MTGFSYDGATYDGASWDDDTPPTSTYLADEPYDGAHWDGDAASGREWVISGTRIRVSDVTLTPTELRLEVRTRRQSERDLLVTLDDNAGDVDDRERADGTVRGLDTAGGSNTYEIRPPVEMRPPMTTRNWLVSDVSRDRTSTDTRALVATLSFTGRETRDERVPVVQTGTDWTFDFAAGGTIVTPRVGDIQQGATTTVPILLTARQAELAETVPAAAAGGVTSTVPDGQTFSRDTTPNDRQTVTVGLPDGVDDAAIDPGDYVVVGWTVRGADGTGFRMTLEISTRYQS